MFVDPAGQYSFELPLGWAYDLERSHLITVYFRLWDQPQEFLSVRAMPTLNSVKATAEDWYKVVDERGVRSDMKPYTRVQCGGMPAALSDEHNTEPDNYHRRVLLVGGTRLDVRVEHWVPEPSTGPRLSGAIDAICASLHVPTNHYLPTLEQQETVDGYLEHAWKAVTDHQWEDVLGYASRALLAAQSTYLYSLVRKAPLPEIPAIAAAVLALYLSSLTPVPNQLTFLRDAHYLVLRALHTNDKLDHDILDLVNGESQRAMQKQLLQQLDLIRDFHIALWENEDEQLGRPESDLALTALRAQLLCDTGKLTAEAGGYTTTLQRLEAGVTDALTALGKIRRPRLGTDMLPSNLTERLASAGIESPMQQAEVAGQLFEYFWLNTLQPALLLLPGLQSSLGDMVGAVRTSDFAIRICRSLVQPTSENSAATIEPQKAQIASLATTLINYANSLADLEDESNLEKAHESLDEAEELLDKMGEEEVLRARLCLTRASVLHTQRRQNGALDVIDRGLHAAAGQPSLASNIVEELKTIKSQFLLNMGETEQARKLALEVVAASEGSTAEAQLRRAGHYLNLAVIDVSLRRVEEASGSLREALRRALKLAPFGEVAVRILTVTGNLYANPQTSYLFSLAAAAALDARRVTIGVDEFRIDFDESERRRQTYESLVGKLVHFGEGQEAAKQAVAAADRARARSLSELLGAPLLVPNASAQSHLEEPPDLQGDVASSLAEGAAYVVRHADDVLRQRGVRSPLRADEVEAFAREINVSTLILQPVGNRIALLLLRPTGEVKMKLSEFTTAELLRMIDAVQESFYIHSVPRGGSAAAGPGEPHAIEADAALVKLWQALIGPIHDFLVEGEPLVIVPYREFTLLPYALLIDPKGRSLIERHALSIVPSLATLRALRAREPWIRARPAKAYIAGDPAVASKHMLRRLPAARAEAEAVAAHLRAAGVTEEDIMLRLREAAHEESYRREARGCDLVHLSCHAQLKEPVYTSRIFFAPHDPYDGLLLASEVADVKLDDALVFLAACETGQGRPTADGIIGLGRAYLEAGARAVVLSLWKVEDAATAALSCHFYRALLDVKERHTAVDALRTAMLATREDLEAGRILTSDNQPLGPNPGNWAPFIVVGDGLSVHYH